MGLSLVNSLFKFTLLFVIHFIFHSIFQILPGLLPVSVVESRDLSLLPNAGNHLSKIPDVYDATAHGFLEPIETVWNLDNVIGVVGYEKPRVF